MNMWNLEDVFSVQIFFIILRETLESAIIVSVLLSFLKQNFTVIDRSSGEIKYTIPISKYRGLQAQVWLGSIIGLLICFFIGACFIAIFYIVGNDLWSVTERLWEGIFSVASCLIISVMGLSLLKLNNLTKKWKFKLATMWKDRENGGSSSSEEEHERNGPGRGGPGARRGRGRGRGGRRGPGGPWSIRGKISHFSEKYSMALLPFVTTLREGLEAVVFVGGMGASAPLSSMPLSIILGCSLGSLIGVTLYKSGNKMSLHYFLIFSTCLLYLIASGLMSRGVWFLELEQFVRACDGIDPSETGSGPGSYDIVKSVWHVNCCNGLTDSYWMILNAIFGWTNSATYGSVISYNLYWIALIIVLKMKIYEEKNGMLPYIPIKWQLRKLQKRVKIYEAVNNTKILLTSSHLETMADESPMVPQHGDEEDDHLLGRPVVGLNHERVIETSS